MLLSACSIRYTSLDLMYRVVGQPRPGLSGCCNELVIPGRSDNDQLSNWHVKIILEADRDDTCQSRAVPNPCVVLMM
jgi:hypothetical protein